MHTVQVEFQGTVSSNPWQDVADIGGEDVATRVHDACAALLEPCRAYRTYVVRSDVRCDDPRGLLRADGGYLDDEPWPQATPLEFSGEVLYDTAAEEWLVGGVGVESAIRDQIARLVAGYIDQSEALTVELVLSVSESEMEALPSPWETTGRAPATTGGV